MTIIISHVSDMLTMILSILYVHFSPFFKDIFSRYKIPRPSFQQFDYAVFLWFSCIFLMWQVEPVSSVGPEFLFNLEIFQPLYLQLFFSSLPPLSPPGTHVYVGPLDISPELTEILFVLSFLFFLYSFFLIVSIIV